MSRVLESYIEQFVDDQGLSGKDDYKKFEYFTNFCVIARHCPTRFDVEEVTSRGGEVGIDGAAILIGDEIVMSKEEAEEKFEERRRDVDVHYIFNQAKNSGSFTRKEMLNFGDAVEDLVSEESRLEQDEWLEEISDISREVLDNAGKVRGGIPKCSLYYTTKGDWKRSKSEDLVATIERINDNLDALNIFRNVDFVPTGFDKLREYWLSTTSPTESTIELEEALSMPPVKGVNQAYVAIVRADYFVDEVIRHEEDGGIRPDIFDQNVRHFLGENNEVNKKIRRTLKDENKKERFPILNNGITILSKNVRRVGNKITIKDFQIVNGCQTSHVLHNNRGKLSEDVTVPIRVIETEHDSVVDEVVEATNSQSEIPDYQMYALKDYVIKLQEFFETVSSDRNERHRVYFERRSKEYKEKNIANIRVFDIHQLSKVFAAMFLDLPHLSTAYAGQLYRKNRDRLFRKEHPQISYYTSAFVYYKLKLIFGGDYRISGESKFKWQLLMLIKYKLGGEQPNWEQTEYMKKYCKNILDKFTRDTIDTIPIVEDALDAIKPYKPVYKDDRKTKRFTENLKDEIL